ncbi:tyrosine-type recombinase/integrase [Amycolatopsis sp.]|jgi:site-specific recombinase XerD|uniref:tyrosine-type recombinase/integrase n=1 Tax=Amycolatopsis sp. TaxID=37632 RepID=UPI002E012F9E|nr:tyrosine-type recombinase/integrase [Amycolatopsis sp.]
MSEIALSRLLESWELDLRAQRKSPQTIKGYLTGARQYLAFCDAHGLEPDLDKPTVNAFVLSLLDAGREASTASTRQSAVKLFSAWLAAEDFIPRDLIIGLAPPQLDKKVVDRLTEDECRALIKACEGKDFLDRRDNAIVRFMLEAIVRASETVDMTVSGTKTRVGTALIVRGKGGKGRTVPFGPQTGRAIDRYLIVREKHRLARSDVLWLGERGKLLGYSGLYKALGYRAKLAGIDNFHPHLTRHTSAQRWLDAGGSEGSLMAVAGWANRDMIEKYTRATASTRAAAEARTLNLGEF